MDVAVVRNAEIRDVSACCMLLEQLWPGTAKGNAQRALLPGLFAHLLSAPTTYVLLVADQGNRVVGYLDASLRETLFHGGLTMTIEDLVVDQAYRRQRIGQILVRAAEIIGRTRDCHAVELSSDLERKESHRFWQALGYKRLAYQFRKVVASEGGRQ